MAPGKVFRLDRLLSLTQPRLGTLSREEEEERGGGRKGGRRRKRRRERRGGIVSAGQRQGFHNKETRAPHGLAAQERSLRSQNRALRMGQRP